MPLLMWLLACGPKTGTLPSVEITVGGVALDVEVADSAEERALGLMYRKSLAPDAGMIFVYPDERPLSFWMENTSVPLSIAFIDSEGVIVNIEDMAPFDRTGIPSDGPAQYALEMNRGWFANHKVKEGDHVGGLPGPATK